MNIQQKVDKCTAIAKMIADKAANEKMSIDKQNCVINAAIAQYVACSITVPTDPMVLPLQYYDTNLLDLVHQLVSGVNEVMPVQTKVIIPLVYNVWYTRYQIACGTYRFDLMAKVFEKSPALNEEYRDAFDDLEDLLEV